MKHRHKNHKDNQSALQMSSDEKKISFLNRYFVFKKVRTVDPNAIYMSDTAQEQVQTQLTKDEIDRVIQQEEAVLAGIPESGLEAKEELTSPDFNEWLDQEGFSPTGPKQDKDTIQNVPSTANKSETQQAEQPQQAQQAQQQAQQPQAQQLSLIHI